MIKSLSLLLLTGCMANDGLRSMSMAQDSIWGLSRLCIGMDESQVLQIMHYPYSKKTFDHEGNIYNIWFYVTRPVGLDQSRMVRQNLTPLTFENGILQGWGFEFFHYVLRYTEKPKAAEEAPKKLTPHENKSIEKAIENIETPPLEPQGNPIPQAAPENKLSGKTLKPMTLKELQENPKQKMTLQPQKEAPAKPIHPKRPKTVKEPLKKQQPTKDQKDKEKKEDDKQRDKAVEEDNDQNFNFW